jgi:hypothetical protein
MFKNFLRDLKIGYELFNRECFVKTRPPTLEGCNFLAFSPFLSIFTAIDTQRGYLHLFFGHDKQWGRTAKWQETLR